MGVGYFNFRMYDKALEYFKLALTMRQALYDEDHPDVVESLQDVQDAEL